jgi:antitoxin (DNA-binding transcriptional repressor) of toxin-antitoxin stability system
METEKNEADVRDVQAHLDAYLRRLQEGEAITFTDQGVTVARLLPPDSSASTGKRLNELQEAGLVEGRAVFSYAVYSCGRGRSFAFGTSS